nr:hypothetical protein CFP56_73664 [Quercus suber]
MSDIAPPSSASQHSNKDQQNRLAAAKTSIKFMLDPQTGPQPTQLRTRAFLRSLRYVTIFLFWRLVRYAKYAAVGALVAAVGSTAIGSVLSGAAFVVAPTGILGGAGVGLRRRRIGMKSALMLTKVHRIGRIADRYLAPISPGPLVLSVVLGSFRLSQPLTPASKESCDCCSCEERHRLNRFLLVILAAYALEFTAVAITRTIRS